MHVAVHRTSDNGLGHGLQQEASRRGGWPRNSRRCRLKGQRGEKVATGGGQCGVGEHKKPLKHPRVWPRSDARALWRAGCRHVILERSFRLQQYAGIKINPSGPSCFPPRAWTTSKTRRYSSRYRDVRKTMEIKSAQVIFHKFCRQTSGPPVTRYAAISVSRNLVGLG